MTPAADPAAPYFDLATLLPLRAAFAALDPAAPPQAVVLARPMGEVGGVSEAVAPPAPQIWGGKDADEAVPAREGDAPSGAFSPQHWGAGGATHAATASHPPESPLLSTQLSALSTRHSPIAILAGSFDPLTNAHLALARAAREAGGGAAVYLALSRHTVNKEARVRPSDADRALLLRLVAAREPGIGVLAFNRGLYADQAVAARAAFPAAAEVRFVVGFDKARQIFDPRYYADRDAALRALFANVALLVAPRDADGPDALAALLARPENRPFRDRVTPLPFDPAWAADSATGVREAAREGRPFADLVPPETVAFIAALRPYDPPAPGDLYTRRETLLARLAAEGRADADLRTLLAAT